jgi:hypothetical protein
MIVPCLLALGFNVAPMRAPAMAGSLARVTPHMAAPVVDGMMAGPVEGPTASNDLDGSTKLYVKKETPPVLGGIKIGTRRVVVVTGASSGLGLWSAKALADKGYFVVCAVRDTKKMDKVAKEVGMSSLNYVAMYLELGSFQSVKDFVSNCERAPSPTLARTTSPTSLARIILFLFLSEQRVCHGALSGHL